MTTASSSRRFAGRVYVLLACPTPSSTVRTPHTLIPEPVSPWELPRALHGLTFAPGVFLVECVRPQGSSAETLQPPLLPQSERHTPGGRLRALPAADPSLWPPPLLSASCFLSAACPRALEPQVAFPRPRTRSPHLHRRAGTSGSSEPTLPPLFQSPSPAVSLLVLFLRFLPLLFCIYLLCVWGGVGGWVDVCVRARACFHPPA